MASHDLLRKRAIIVVINASLINSVLSVLYKFENFNVYGAVGHEYLFHCAENVHSAL